MADDDYDDAEHDLREADALLAASAPVPDAGGGGFDELLARVHRVIHDAFGSWPCAWESRGGDGCPILRDLATMEAFAPATPPVPDDAAFDAAAYRAGLAAPRPAGVDREALDRYRALRDIGPCHRGDCNASGGEAPTQCDCDGVEEYAERLASAADAALAPLLGVTGGGG